jgi:SAM-dependent methyltransferase
MRHVFFAILSVAAIGSLITYVLLLDKTTLWFSADLPSINVVLQWTEKEKGDHLFRLSRWEQFIGLSQFRRFVRNQIKGLNLSASDSFHFLEVGVGVGAFTREILAMFPNSTCTGIDMVPQAIAIASAVSPAHRSNFTVADMRDLSGFSTKSFDVIFVPGAICYLHSMQEVRQAVSEFARVLRKQGGLCLSMVASDISPMGSCNVRIPKEFWRSEVKTSHGLQIESMEEMDDWRLPHSYGRYSTCLRKRID